MDILLIIAVIYCVYTDVRYKVVKNYITFPLMFLGVVYNLYIGNGLLFSLSGVAFCGICAFFIKKYGHLGMGDIKLFIGIGALKGFEFSLDVFVISFFSLVFYVLICRPKVFISACKNIWIIFKSYMHTKEIYKIEERDSALLLPFAVFIFVGLIITYLLGGEYIWSLIKT